MDAMEQIKTVVSSENFLEIKYEDLCSDPLSVFKQVINFSNLDVFPQFDEMIRKYPLKNTNDQWKSELTGEQQTIMEAVLGDHLKKYNYS